jgi:hypothetical protein
MTAGRKIRAFLLFVLTLFVGMVLGMSPARGDSVMSINKVPGQVESKARRLTQDFKKQGFEVSRGYFKPWRREDCDFTIAKLGSCFGNNPAAPYVTLAVPPWPEEFVGHNSNVLAPSRPGYHDVFRLDPGEAIVILAEMPPPARYFSVQTFVFTREGTYDTDSETYKNIAADPGINFMLPFLFRTVEPHYPERIFSWADLNNPVNNVVMERRSGTAFSQLRYFIITPDDFMNKAVRKALSGISVEDEHIFTEPIPYDMNFGLHRAADDFMTLIRYARPDDGGAPRTASDTWRKNLPMVVLRVRDTRHEPQPYPQMELEPRTAFDEYTLQPDLISLVSGVHERWTGQPCANDDCSDVADSLRDLQTPPISLLGLLCLPIGQNCLGPNRDTTYQVYRPQPLDDGEIYAVAGTLGTETGNATYVGFGINQMPIMIGVANLPDELLKGTAAAYAGEVNNTDRFFLYYLTRDCSGLEYLTDNHCFEIDETMVPPGNMFGLAVRDYMRPGTQRGPDSALVLPPMVLKLQRP